MRSRWASGNVVAFSRTRRMCLAGIRRLRISSGSWPSISWAAIVPRLRIVPDVPITRS